MIRMGKGKTVHRILAYVLTICLVISGVSIPVWKAEADSISLDLKPDTSIYTATVTESGGTSQLDINIAAPSEYHTVQELIDAGYTELKIGYKVSKYTAYSGGTPGVLPYIAHGDSWKYTTDGWSNLSDAGEGTVTISLSKAAASDELKRFGLLVCNVTGEVTYQITSAVLTGTGSSTGGGTGGSSGTGNESLEEIGTVSSKVTADYTIGSGSNAGDGYYEYDINISNGSSSYISDWIAVADVSGSVTSVADNTSWSELAGIYSKGKLYIYPNTSKKSGSVSAGSSQSYSKIAYNGVANTAVISGITVYYSSSQGAFSNFINSLSSDSGGAEDGSLDIVTDIEYNYAKLLQESLYFYDANMCGADVKEKSELSWRDNCHTGDQYVSYDGQIIDLSGGYHDAGDHAKFGLPQAYAASTLGISYYQFKAAFTELELTAHYKRIMDRFTDYFERCTVLDENGNVKAFCYQVGSGNTDHGYWGAPEKQADRSNQVWFTSSSVPATDIVCETAAALTIYYMNFKSSDSKNADKALQYAKKLFAYANSFGSKSCVKIEIDNATGEPFYNSKSWEDDYALAAAWLYKATGDSTYASAYNSVYASKNWVGWVLSWDDVSSIAMLYGPNESQRKYVADYVTKAISEQTQTGDNNYVKLESWGTARYNCALQMTGLIYDSDKYGSWANGQMKYLLGNNAGHHCFVIGYNKYSVKYPHHRAASGYEGSVAGTREQAHSLVGALVGGPSNTSSSYIDTADDYNQNEVALDYNAGLVGAAAGLYLYIKDNGTDAEKNVQKTVPKSEISNEIRKLQEDTSEDPSSEELTTEEPSTEIPVVKVEHIDFDKTSITLYVGESDRITADVKPLDAANKSLAWSSSDRDVVSVSDGKITALSKGTATIKATAKDGSGVSADCTVTVKSLGKLSTDKENIDMGQLVYGYTNSDIESAKASVILTNTGEKAVEGVSVALDKGSSFELTNVPAQSISSGGTGTITVKAKQSLNAGTYHDTIEITSDSGSFHIPVSLTVVKALSDTTVQLKVNMKTDSGIALSADITGSSSNIEYAITTEKNADASKLVWQDLGTFSNLNEFTTYYLYARSKADDNHNSGKISAALEVTTLVRDPYTIDISKITSPDCAYIEALKDSDGVSTVDAYTKDGVLTILLSNKNQPYVITGSNSKLVVAADGVSDITLKNAELDKLELGMSGSGSVNLKTEGTNRIHSGITLNQDKANAEAGLIVSSHDKNGVLNVSSTGKPAIEVIEKLTIVSGNINISSDYQCISAGSVEISGGNVQASVAGNAGGRPAIEAEKEITLSGGSISVTTSSETDISFGVAESGKIVIDGDVAITGNPIYSTEPVDKNGDKLRTVNVIFADDMGNTLMTYQMKTGSALNLGGIIIKNADGFDYAASKEDYSLNWTDGSNVYTTNQRIENINGDIMLKAVWTWKVVNMSKTSISAIKSVTYTGKAVCPAVSVTYKNNKLTAGTDYKLTYRNNVNAGTASVTITGIHQYSGSVTKSFIINKQSIAGGNVKYASSVVYTGSALKPTVSVTCASKILKSGTDYTVTYKNNKNIGKASVIITGKGNYAGTLTKTFNITVKKGKVYKVGSYKYKITNAATNGKGTVMLMGTTKKQANVVIKSTVKIGGKRFKVTAINNKAFRKNKAIRKLTIPASVTKIGKQAFYGCSKLKTIIIYSTKLKSKNVGAKAFKGIYKKAVIKVPKSKLKTYKKLLKSKGVPSTAAIKKK